MLPDWAVFAALFDYFYDIQAALPDWVIFPPNLTTLNHIRLVCSATTTTNNTTTATITTTTIFQL